MRTATKVIGVLLIALGALALVFGGFTRTEEETVLDIGPIEATAETEERVPIPVWASLSAIGLGAIILIAGRSDRRA